MATPAPDARLIPAVDLYGEWHPLTSPGPPPEYIPDCWTGPHAGQRLIEALRVLTRIPMTRGPRLFNSAWPSYCWDWADLLAQQEAEQEQKDQTERQQNRT